MIFLALLGKLVRMALSLVVLIGVMAVIAWAMLHNEAMTARVLPLLPMVKVQGASGALLGDFRASRIDIALPRGGHITILDPVWRQLEVVPDAGVAWQVAVKAEALSVRRLDFNWVPRSPSAAPVPLSDLDLPLQVKIARVQVGEAHARYWGTSPLMQLDAGVALQVPRGLIGREHKVSVSSVAWQTWRASGEARAGTGGKMPIDATLLVQGSPVTAALQAAQADLRVQGPLARLLVKGRLNLTHLQEAGKVGEAEKQGWLDVEGEVAPLSPWPLTKLWARAVDVDLANLHASLPATLLSGDVHIEPTAKHDLQARLELRNTLPGVWDEGRLPVRRLQGQIALLGARDAKTVAATLKDGVVDVVAQLPSVGPHEPGVLSLKGGWGASRTLSAEWRGLTPRALHTAAPPLQLQGNVLVKPQWLEGLSQLAQTQAEISGQAQGLHGSAFAGAGGVGGKAKSKGVAAASVHALVPVSMNLSAQYGPGRLLIRQWKLQALAAQAEVRSSLLEWGGAVPWRLAANVSVQDFDPKVWLPWPVMVTGANRLSGKVGAKVDAAWRGEVKADVAPSMLGGVPLQGQVVWRSPLASQLMQLHADIDAGGNSAVLKVDLPWRRDAQGAVRWGEGAMWQGRIQAPALKNLQALAPLLGAARIDGVIQGEGSAKGLWPALATQGRVDVSRFQWDVRDGQSIRLEAAKADWQLDMQLPDAPVRAHLALTKGQVASAVLERADLSLEGTLASHRTRLVADGTQQIPRQRKPTPFHVEWAAQGGMLRDKPASGRGAFSAWQGQVSQLLLRTGGTSPRILLYAQPFAMKGGWHGDARQLTVSPTNVNVLGADLAIQRLEWTTASVLKDPVGDAHVEMRLSPLSLSTVLASWQPQAGWGGDLQLTGRITLHNSLEQAMQVDAEIQRASGDLTLAEPTIEGQVVQRLGIRQASVNLQARDGLWVVNEQFEGRLFGQFKARQTVKTSDPGRLPSGADPLSGEISMLIRNLRPWGAWLPAGWRLAGQLQAQAQLGGTLGAPEYAGTVDGEGLGVGQALMGVNVTDGVLQMKLEGDHLTLTRFEARSGSQGGSLTASGQAVLGAAPELRLQLKAERFGLLQRVDRRVVISGDASAVAGAEDIKVDGRVMVDEGLIDISRSDAPTVGEDVFIVNRPREEGEEPEEDEDVDAGGGGSGAMQRKLDANFDVDLGRKLRLKGRGLDAFLTGALKLTTPGNRPSIRGTVRVENGTYAAYGQKLVIERGAVAFSGPIENPRLDILAMRAQSPTAASSDVKVGVNITGTALDPRVRLYSDPAMSETEKLSWLVLGRAPTGLGGADIGLLQTAAVALLSGEGSSPSDNLVGLLGLDELSVRQTDGAVRDTVVNLGKQVSRNWYVGYERNLNATSGNWQLIYQLAQRFTLRGQAGDDNAIDLIWSWRWD